MSDAMWVVTQLQSEAQKLNESNEDLKMKINELKVGFFLGKNPRQLNHK